MEFYLDTLPLKEQSRDRGRVGYGLPWRYRICLDMAPARGISIYLPPFLDRSAFYREPGANSTAR